MPTVGDDGAAVEEQLTLVPPPAGSPRRRRTGPPADRPPAASDPVARVVVDTPLAHLDRVFEYVVPQDLDEQVRPGVRVRVRMAGRQQDGFVVARAAEAEHPGRLAPVVRVVGSEPVLTQDVLSAARAVADHYGGTLADVLRLAVPPRHARAETEEPGEVPHPGSGAPEPVPPADPAAVPWEGSPA
ncbi:MAG TPA: hypothetical protein VLO09_03155, partial [Ornithinimicrobium sp.]|nr:hypothetical protein [Ornithinimicrobium sp.]